MSVILIHVQVESGEAARNVIIVIRAAARQPAARFARILQKNVRQVRIISERSKPVRMARGEQLRIAQATIHARALRLAENVRIQLKNVQIIAAISAQPIPVPMVVGELVQVVARPRVMELSVENVRIQRPNVMKSLLVLRIQNRPAHQDPGEVQTIVRPVFPMLWALVPVRQIAVRLNVNQVIANPDLLA